MLMMQKLQSGFEMLQVIAVEKAMAIIYLNHQLLIWRKDIDHLIYS